MEDVKPMYSKKHYILQLTIYKFCCTYIRINNIINSSTWLPERALVHLG